MNPNYTKLNKYLLRGSETKIAITYKADRNKFLVKLQETMISLSKAEFYLTCFGIKPSQSEITVISNQHHVGLSVFCT